MEVKVTVLLTRMLLLCTLFTMIACQEESPQPASPGSALNTADEHADAPRLFPIRVNGKGGYIDREGRIVIEPQFALISEFWEGRAVVRVEGIKGDGMIDETGRYIVEPTPGFYIGRFREGRAVFDISKTWDHGYIDRDGNVIIPAIYATASDFHNGMAHVRLSPMNSDETFAQYAEAIMKLPPWRHANYERVSPSEVGIPIEHFYIDKWGKRLKDLPVNEEEPVEWASHHPEEGLTPEKVGDVYGYTDENGVMVIEPRFSHASEFSEGLASVRVDGKWGYTNKRGEIVIEPQWKWGRDFRGGLAQVVLEGGYRGYINRDGDYVWEPTR